MNRPVIFLAIVLYILCAGFSAADVGSMERKPFVLDTVLVDQGRPNAVIVCPEAKEYRQLAAGVNAAIQDATGVSLPVRNDSEYASLRGELKKPEPDANLIVLGNQDSSGMVTYLCLMGYCAIDTLNPGEGGYMVRTVHDLWVMAQMSSFWLEVILMGCGWRSTDSAPVFRMDRL